MYKGLNAGKSAGAAEAKLQAVVKRIVDKAAGFTTTKFDKAKGYNLRLEVAKVEVANHKTHCDVSGSLVRYPATATLNRGGGEEMVSTRMTAGATADGISEASLLDAVEAAAESLVTKSIPVMSADFMKR
jgi:hypothetical protein